MNDWSKQESLKYLKDKIEGIRTAMLTTYNDDSGFHSRPMGTADVDEEGNIWFFTNNFSAKTDEVEVKHSISLTYTDISNHTYISIAGQALLVDDKAKMKELWNPFVKAFFPKGLDDQKLILIKVEPTDAEYWDSSSSSMVLLFNILKAVVTGKQYDEGTHGKIDL